MDLKQTGMDMGKGLIGRMGCSRGRSSMKAIGMLQQSECTIYKYEMLRNKLSLSYFKNTDQ